MSDRRTRLLPWALLALALLVAGLAVMRAGRGTTFYFDDWNFVLERQGWTTWALLHPHNEHLSVIPAFIYKLVLELFGLDSYGLLRAISAAVNLLCGLLLFLYARVRVGPWIAVALAAALVVMTPAWWDLLWAFQMGFLLSVAAGLGALLAVDRGDRAGDVAACVLLAVALGSSSLGLPILGAAILEVLLRPDRRARAWVVAAPAVLYAAWYLRYGEGGTKLSNASEIPRWIFDAADDAAAAITGFGADYGRLALIAVAVLAVWRLAQGRPSPRLIALIALPLGFWALTALGRADFPGVTPSESRYLYPGGLWLALVAVEAGAGVVLRAAFTAAIAVVLAFGALANLNALDPSGDLLRQQAETTRGALAALEAAGPRVPYETRPESGQSQLIAGHYFKALERYGSSSAPTESELATATDRARNQADASALAIAGQAVVAGDDGRRCTRRSPPAADADVELPLPSEGIVLRAAGAPVEVRLRRFGGFGEAVGTVPAGGSAVVRVTADGFTRPWTAGARSAAPFSVCEPA